jgi:hypothetical protein
MLAFWDTKESLSMDNNREEEWEGVSINRHTKKKKHDGATSDL